MNSESALTMSAKKMLKKSMMAKQKKTVAAAIVALIPTKDLIATISTHKRFAKAGFMMRNIVNSPIAKMNLRKALQKDRNVMTLRSKITMIRSNNALKLRIMLEHNTERPKLHVMAM